MTVDDFGITHLFATKSSGRTFTSNWHNGINRSYSSGETHQDTDPEVCFTGNNGTYVISGDSILIGDPTSSIGTLNMYGKAPRIYVRSTNEGIADNSSGYGREKNLRPWNSCEMTIYSLYTRNDCFQSYSGITMAWGCNHIPDKNEDLNSNYGDYSSRTMYGQLQCLTGKCYAKKENYFPSTLTEISSIERTPFNGPSPLNQWIGIKTIFREYSNANKLNVQMYMDLTNGTDGGTWTKIMNFNDVENWGNSFSPIQFFAELAHFKTADYSYFASRIQTDSNTEITADDYLQINNNGYINWAITSPTSAGCVNCYYVPLESPPSNDIILYGFKNDANENNKMYLYIDTSNNIKLYVNNASGSNILNTTLSNESFVVGNYYVIELNYNASNQYLYVNQLLKAETTHDISENTGGCDKLISQSLGSTYKIGRMAFNNAIKHTDLSYPSKENKYDVPQQSMENDKVSGQKIHGGFWYGKPICHEFIGKSVVIGNSEYQPAQCNYSVFFRNDYTEPTITDAQFFKWFSVREIDEPYQLPVPTIETNVGNIIEVKE